MRRVRVLLTCLIVFFVLIPLIRFLLHPPATSEDYVVFKSCEQINSENKTPQKLKINYRYKLVSVSAGGTYTRLYYKGSELRSSDYNGSSGQFTRGTGECSDEVVLYKSTSVDEIRIFMVRDDPWSLLEYNFFKTDRTIRVLSVKINIEYRKNTGELIIEKLEEAVH
ncbi:MAG: hypothetical protein HQM08_06380 [Candidatus Riflebacteria bacterium]|nr:hypothetical protein [Candidatus Riflebacteria bacterium]